MENKGVVRKQSMVRALDKALSVLEYLSQIDGDVDLGVLARQIRLPKSTLIRLLTTLRHHDFVQQDPITRRYRLGWALIYLGRAAGKAFDLIKAVRPYLEQLAAETSETASLVQLGGNRAVYVDQVTSNSLIRGVPQIGASLELHCTASGKILLGSLQEDRIEQFLRESQLPRRTEKTITDPNRFKEELQRIRRQGYALDDEEGEIGGRCVAAPVVNRDGCVVAAFSVTGPTSRIKQKDIPHLAEVVCRIARQASQALGAGTPAVSKIVSTAGGVR